MRISDWSSDVCASDLIVVDCAKAPAGSGRDRDRESSTRRRGRAPRFSSGRTGIGNRPGLVLDAEPEAVAPGAVRPLQSLPAPSRPARSEEHTSELQSLMRKSYAGLCLKKNSYKYITSKSNNQS